MIISNMIGGLGNQMFQYAFGRALSLRLNAPLRLATDGFASYKLHNGLELHRVFAIDTPVASHIELEQVLGLGFPAAWRKYLSKTPLPGLLGGRWFNERSFGYVPACNDLGGDVYLHGYWQSERYFLDQAKTIRADFSFRAAMDAQDHAVLDMMRAAPSVAIHVRRGDYLIGRNQSKFHVCPVAYYEDAVRAIRNQAGPVRIFAFSDDHDWVQAVLAPLLGNIISVRHNSGMRSANDMRLFSMADHQVIANSSFSWWGGWLNPNLGKIVIAPRRWFCDGTDDSDLVPSDWARM